MPPHHTSSPEPTHPRSLRHLLSKRTLISAATTLKRRLVALPRTLRSLPGRIRRADYKQFYRQHFFPSLGGLLAAIALVPFLAIGVQAASAELIPNANVSNDWPTIVGSSGCSGACGAVNDGSSPDTNSYIATVASDSSNRTVEFGLTSVSNIEEATQIRIRVFANAVTRGSGADTLTLNALVGGTSQGSTTVTPALGSYTWLEHTINGSWTQAQIDDLHVRLVRNVVGSGNPDSRGDQIRVASVYVDLTYESAVELEQSSYRWFENDNNVDGGGSALVGNPLTTQDTPAEAPAEGTPFRLRASVSADLGDLPAEAGDFKLQYAELGPGAVCTLDFSGGEDYQDVPDSTTSEPIKFHDNTNIPHGSAIAASPDDPAPSGLGSPVLQSYVESNPFTNPNTIPNGDYGIWDFSLVDNGASSGATYCFRIVLDSGDELQMYSVIAELSIPPPALTQADYRWYRSAQPLIWSPAIGWINLGAGGSIGTRVYDTHLEGFAWSENVGWIKLGTHTGGSSHSYANTDETDWGVNRDPSTGELSGYAWSPSAGWINFDPSFGGVSYNQTNEAYSGFAWGETFGWISTDGARGNFLIDDSQPIASEYTPPISTPVAAQNTRAEVRQRNQPIRLRLVLEVASKDFTTDLSAEYKVQYALGIGDTCPIDFIGQDYQDIDASTTRVRFMSNIGATDGGGIVADSNDPTGIPSLVNQTYHQSNPLSFSGNNEAPAGSAMLIDFSFDDATSGAGLYCFRVVRDDGMLIAGYERIAELFTPPGNPQLMRHGRFFDDSGISRPFFW